MLAGGVAYFALISLAPMLVIALRVTALFVGQSTGQEELLGQLGTIIGSAAAETVASMIESARLAERSTVTTVIGVAIIVFAGTTLFAKLGEALNAVFGVQPSARSRAASGAGSKAGAGMRSGARDEAPAGGAGGTDPKGRGFVRPGVVVRTLKRRLFALALAVAIGLLLLLSLIVDTAVVSLFPTIRRFFAEQLAFMLAALNLLLSTALSALLFATVLKVMTDRSVAWRNALAGGATTAVLFSAAKIAFGLALGNQSVASTYGAAGAVVVLLLWVFLAAVALLLGAELAAVLERRRMGEERPSDA
jgi:membrane protein